MDGNCHAVVLRLPPRLSRGLPHSAEGNTCDKESVRKHTSACDTGLRGPSKAWPRAASQEEAATGLRDLMVSALAREAP
eukprot:4014629-Alexandrium_andersonii.AAC.1